MARLALLPLVLAALAGQSPLGDLPAQHAAKPAAVSFLFPEQVSVAANKPAKVDLHFKVADGLHLNSHTPHGEGLIPTTLTAADGSEVRLAKTDFPQGTDFAFPDDPSQKLSVYTGEFVVQAEIVAAKGNHLMQATLRYQACSSNTCMPPHSIPVAVDVIAE